MVAYPELSEDTCERFEEADKIKRAAFIFQEVICPDCVYRDDCGYYEGYHRAMSAPHSVATLKRGEVSMKSISDGKDYVTIHETPLAMLRPVWRAVTGFLPVAELAKHAEMIAPWKDKCARAYYAAMRRAAKDLDGYARGSVESEVIPLPASAEPPYDAHRHLYGTMRDLGMPVIADALRLVMLAAAGELDGMLVTVDTIRRKNPAGGEPLVEIVRNVMGLGKVDLPPDATIIINDGTGTLEEIQAAAGRPVKDITPKGHLPFAQAVLQIPQDVTKSATPGSVSRLLRGIVHDLPAHLKRIGVITHMAHVPHLREEAIPRIARIDYFRSGQSRASNVWIEDCDALIVLGTPRVPPSAIREHLFRLGNLRGALLPGGELGWGDDVYTGRTVSGKIIQVQTRAYRHHSWHDAYRSLVHSELIQSFGRARPILPQGIPVWVVTTEDLGLPLADPGTFVPLTEPQTRALHALYSPRGMSKGMSAPEVAGRLGVNRQRALEILTELVGSGRVRTFGNNTRKRFKVNPGH